MAIVVCGLSHKSVELPVLEQLALGVGDLPKALLRLVDAESVHEAAILSTCNRVEVYATVHRYHPAVREIRTLLSDLSGVAVEQVADGSYAYYDNRAVRHLFEVACGADSMVVGDAQILGQVREAFRAATEERTARHTLSPLFQRALRTGKRARTETGISRHVLSLPHVAARTAAELAGGLSGKTMLVVGAGRMGELAARAALENGCTHVVIANRTRSRADAAASALGVRGAGLEEVPDLLSSVDVVVSVTAAHEPLIDTEMLGRRRRGLVVIDLGMPRNVDPAVRSVRGVTLRDLSELAAVVDRNTQARRAELERVHAIIAEEIEAFGAWQRSLSLGPAIDELRGWAEHIRAREVERFAAGMDAKQREAVERMTRGIVNKLLHRPMTQMRELAGGKDGQVFLEAFREIFDLRGTTE